jgi:hypothetical protein
MNNFILNIATNGQAYSRQQIYFLQSQNFFFALQLFDSVIFITGFVWASHLIEVIELNIEP